MVTEESVSVIGRVRIFDLDKNSYALVDADGKRHPFDLAEDLQEEALGYAVSGEMVMAQLKLLSEGHSFGIVQGGQHADSVFLSMEGGEPA